MHGRATTLGVDTVLNALVTVTGSAFATDTETTTSVELDDSGEVCDNIAEAPDADVHLVERCIELTIKASSDGKGGTVETESGLPTAAGLESSNAAASATALAMLLAFGRSVGPDPDVDIPHLDTCRMGVRTAYEVGITTTGVFDDAAVSMAGGVVVTDNTENGLIARDEVDQDVLVWTPSKRTHSAGADVSRRGNVAPIVDLAADLALEGRYAEAITVNGLALSAALDFPTGPAVEAIPIADGVSLPGTGPDVAIVGGRTDLECVKGLWDARERKIRLTATRTDGVRIQ